MRLSFYITAILLFLVIPFIAGPLMAEGEYLFAYDEGTEPVSQEKNEKATQSVSRTNVDAELMYGQYNNIYSTFSIIQNHDRFTYQLNSDFRRSNDFGYNNSSYNNSQIGFTGKAEFFENWKFIPQIDVYNLSHGMFDNSSFSREEKDKIAVVFKNEYKPTPTRWNFNLGGVQYVHRLTSRTADSVESSLYKVFEEVEWEYILSPSNKFSIKHSLEQYTYDSDEIGSDITYISNEFSGGFRFSEFFQLGITGIVDWDRDEGLFPAAKIQLGTVGLKYISFDIGYRNELVPFRPDDIYFSQNFVLPDRILASSTLHRGEASMSLEADYGSGTSFSVKKIRFKAGGGFEDNSRFANFYPIDSTEASVIGIEGISAQKYDFISEFSFDCLIFARLFRFSVNYTYENYTADVNVTYRPEHQFDGSIKYIFNRGEVEWSNRITSSVYVSPFHAEVLQSATVGSLKLQFQIAETLYFNLLLNNLYGAEYSYRNGYPEPGFTALAGLRIVI